MPFKGTTWKQFLNGLASEGGNLLILIFLIVLMCTLGLFGYGDAFHQAELVIAAILGYIRGNKEKQEGD